MNGDPDSPVVVGCFYHQEAQPPFPIPERQTKQGWRTRMTPRGGGDHSEISIDAAGEELMYLQAQKDQTTFVKNDQRLTVKNSRTVRVDASETKTIGDSYGMKTETGPISVNAEASTIDISATVSITLRVADNFILINDEGITLNGNVVTLTAGGAITATAMGAIAVSALADVTIESAILTVESPLFLVASPPIPEEL